MLLRCSVLLLLAVLRLPGTTLPGCLPSFLRSFAHLQQLAASATLTAVGLPASYAAAADLVKFSLLNFMPRRFVAFAAAFAVSPASTSSSTARLTWAPAPVSSTAGN